MTENFRPKFNLANNVFVKELAVACLMTPTFGNLSLLLQLFALVEDNEVTFLDQIIFTVLKNTLIWNWTFSIGKNQFLDISGSVFF